PPRASRGFVAGVATMAGPSIAALRARELAAIVATFAPPTQGVRTIVAAEGPELSMAALLAVVLARAPEVTTNARSGATRDVANDGPASDGPASDGLASDSLSIDGLVVDGLPASLAELFARDARPPPLELAVPGLLTVADLPQLFAAARVPLRTRLADTPALLGE
ncbi:hypothetical protein L6R52_32765, partial [Myxococcota bacterium]|nr:hypothetical protein [Myxococcota bacterium]